MKYKVITTKQGKPKCIGMNHSWYTGENINAAFDYLEYISKCAKNCGCEISIQEVKE